MNSIVEAICAAVSSGAIAGITETTASAVNTSLSGLYFKFRSVFKDFYGEDSAPTMALELLEHVPDSERHKAILDKYLCELPPPEELFKLANSLLNLASNTQSQISQIAIGSNIAQASQSSTASVSVSPQR